MLREAQGFDELDDSLTKDLTEVEKKTWWEPKICWEWEGRYALKEMLWIFFDSETWTKFIWKQIL